METALVIVALIAYMGFREWLRHNRRTQIHRERLAAIEKGIELAPLQQEVHRRDWNVQRFLLLAGLIWISLGVSLFVTLSALLSAPANANAGIPPGIQWGGLAPVAIGLSHLIVYLAGKKNEAWRIDKDGK
jgi:hypothetical protein